MAISWLRALFWRNSMAVDYEYVRRALACGRPPVVDVRGAAEIARDGALPGAANIPLGEVQAALARPEQWPERYGVARAPARDEEVILSCRSGVRARVAAEMFRQAGYVRATVYDGSYLDYAAHMRHGK